MSTVERPVLPVGAGAWISRSRRFERQQAVQRDLRPVSAVGPEARAGKRRRGSGCHRPDKRHSADAVREEGRMQIRVDDLRGRDIAELLAAHLDHCRTWSPPER
jgi:hypothetical protein